jgi:hypothetical protein
MVLRWQKQSLSGLISGTHSMSFSLCIIGQSHPPGQLRVGGREIDPTWLEECEHHIAKGKDTNCIVWSLGTIINTICHRLPYENSL